MDNIDQNDLDKFIRGWRKFFVTKLNPQYIPDNWSIDFSTYRQNIKLI